MKLTRIALVAALTVASSSLFAQTAAPTPTPAPTVAPAAKPMTINQRKENQQDRIAQGIDKGTLSAGEAAHLEGQEAAINKEEHAMRAQDNGHLTKQDRKTLHMQQNQESRRIHRTKHDIGHK